MITTLEESTAISIFQAIKIVSQSRAEHRTKRSIPNAINEEKQEGASNDLLPSSSSTRPANSRNSSESSGCFLYHLGVLGTLDRDLDTVHIKLTPIALVRESR